MKRAILLLCATFFVVSAEPKKDSDDAHRQRTANRSWTYAGEQTRNRSAAPDRRYRRATPDLPHGLAKRNGNLPPGLQKHEDRTGHLPRGLEKRNHPARIVVR